MPFLLCRTSLHGEPGERTRNLTAPNASPGRMNSTRLVSSTRRRLLSQPVAGTVTRRNLASAISALQPAQATANRSAVAQANPICRILRLTVAPHDAGSLFRCRMFRVPFGPDVPLPAPHLLHQMAQVGYAASPCQLAKVNNSFPYPVYYPEDSN